MKLCLPNLKKDIYNRNIKIKYRGKKHEEDHQTLNHGIAGICNAPDSGCGKKFDATGYVNSFMKMITQGDVSDYMKLTDQSEEEAKGDYQKMLDEMASMLENFGASEEVQNKVTDAFIALLAKAKYTVHDAVEVDGGFDVDVEIEPIQGVYDGMMEELQNEAMDAVSSNEITTDEIYDWLFTKMADKMTEKLDSITYGTPETVTVHLEKNGNVYEIKDDSATGEKIGQLLIDQSALN